MSGTPGYGVISALLPMSGMNRLAVVLVLVSGCADHKRAADQLAIEGDACAARLDKASCAADLSCTWFALGRPCPVSDSTCPSGVCQSSSSGGGGGGTGTGSAACVCFDGGVCFEQVGGTVQPAGGPVIECAAVPDQGDRCALIEGQGHCVASPNVTGLCICDNGLR